MSAFLRHIYACTRHDPGKFVPFTLGARPVGWVLKELTAVLAQAGSDFDIGASGVVLSNKFTTYESRTAALTRATDTLARHYGASLRGEMYAVVEKWGDEPLAELDRSAVPWFGVRGFGVHVNGYVRKADGIYLWIGERSQDRLIDPGKLDNLVGGGMPVGFTVEESLLKEAWEEAGIDAALARTAQAVGSLNYKVEMMGGLRNDTLFVYDLELPEDFLPRNTDGEVGAFMLMPIAEVVKIVQETDRFKFNCNLVIIDFMLRHGLIGAEDKVYAALVEAMNNIRE